MTEQTKEQAKTEEKPMEQKDLPKKDYFKAVDDVYQASGDASKWTDKFLDLLGEHKGPVMFGLILSGALSLLDYPFLAKTVAVLIVATVLLKIVLSRKSVRDNANVIVGKGIDKTKEIMAKKKETGPTVNSQTKEEFYSKSKEENTVEVSPKAKKQKKK